MAAYTPFNFSLPATERSNFQWVSSVFDFSQRTDRIGPILYCIRYSAAGSTSFLYIQTDRVLLSSGSMTTTTNYVVNGTSAPSVTAVVFTTGKNYIRLTLSGTLVLENRYTLTVKTDTFYDGYRYNTVNQIPIYVDTAPSQSGVAETINVGTPVIS